MSTLNLANHFLVAMPSLEDPNFKETVTLICLHGKEGAMGIVINRPLDLQLGAVLEQMQITSSRNEVNQQPVFEGGPVYRDHGFILHRPAGAWGSTIPVSSRLAISTSKDILEAISDGRGPEASLVALGYAGWGAGQLEDEIAANAWLSVAADESIIFELPPELRWRAALTKLGCDPVNIVHSAGHA
jgi:putative transcriptional regulator